MVNLSQSYQNYISFKLVKSANYFVHLMFLNTSCSVVNVEFDRGAVLLGGLVVFELFSDII